MSALSYSPKSLRDLNSVHEFRRELQCRVNVMNIAIALLLLLCLSLMLWGLVSVVQNLLEKAAYDQPEFREPGPIFHDHSAPQLVARSQFAWQSRSHSKAPD
jgi:hypothetical protein